MLSTWVIGMPLLFIISGVQYHRSISTNKQYNKNTWIVSQNVTLARYVSSHISTASQTQHSHILYFRCPLCARRRISRSAWRFVASSHTHKPDPHTCTLSRTSPALALQHSVSASPLRAITRPPCDPNATPPPAAGAQPHHSRPPPRRSLCTGRQHERQRDDVGQSERRRQWPGHRHREWWCESCVWFGSGPRPLHCAVLVVVVVGCVLFVYFVAKHAIYMYLYIQAMRLHETIFNVYPNFHHV